MGKHLVEEYASDLLDDGKLTEDNKARLVRTARTLAQAAVAAVVVTVGDAVMSAVQDGEVFDPATVGKAAVTAAVTAVVSYFHKRK